MATVTGFTASRMLEIENSAIVSGAVDLNGRLQLVSKDGTQHDAGKVVGATGPVGPPASIMMFGGSTAPSGWLLCNGAEVSRTTYSALFAAIGTIYGIGNGTSTFTLPDFTGRSPRQDVNLLGVAGGSDTHSHATASHNHVLNDLGSALLDWAVGGGVKLRRGFGGGTATLKSASNFATLTSDSSAMGSSVSLNGTTAQSGTQISDAASSLSPYLNVNFIIKT